MANTSLNEASSKIADRLYVFISEFDKIKPIIEDDIESGRFLKDGEIQTSEIELRAQEYPRILDDNFITQNKSVESRGLLIPPCSWAVACVLYFAVAIHNSFAVANLIAVAVLLRSYFIFLPFSLRIRSLLRSYSLREYVSIQLSV